MGASNASSYVSKPRLERIANELHAIVLEQREWMHAAVRECANLRARLQAQRMRGGTDVPWWAPGLAFVVGLAYGAAIMWWLS